MPGPATVNMRAAKTKFCELVARAEKGERIIIARAGKPAAILEALTEGKRRKFWRNNRRG